MYQKQHTTSDLLREAALGIIVEKGLSGLSSRDVAAAAGVSAAAINRRYGSQGKLVIAALEEGLEAFARHAASLRTEIDGIRVDANQAPAFLLGLMNELWLTRSDVTLIGWHICTLPAGEPENLNLRRAWHKTDMALWEAARRALDLPEQAAELLQLTLGSLVRGALITASPVLFRSLIFDLCLRLSHRLDGEGGGADRDNPWRTALAGRHGVTAPAFALDQHPSKRAIITAAADHIEQSGPQGLTHRLIAERAGVSLSSTTHHFSGLGEILFEGILELIGRTDTSQFGESSLTVPEYAAYVGDYAARPQTPLVRRLAEVELMTRYHPELHVLADRLLLRHGNSSTQMLRALKGRRSQIDRMDGILWHHTVTGLLESAEVQPLKTRRSHVTGQLETWATHLFCAQQ